MKRLWVFTAPVVLVSLALAACSFSGLPPVQDSALPPVVSAMETGRAVLLVQPVATHLSKALAAAPSRAFMFIPELVVRIYHPDYPEAPYRTHPFELDNQSPGMQQRLDMNLPVGENWRITVDVYNPMQPAGLENTVRGELESVTVLPNPTNDPEVNFFRVTCLPISPLLVEDGHISYSTLAPSVYDTLEDGFTAIGGESWFEFTPTASVKAFTLTPHTEGSYIYAAVFNQYGKYLFSNLSSTFFGGDEAAVLLDMGVTPGDTYYLGTIPIVPTGSATTAETLTIQYGDSQLSDDDYESSGTYGENDYYEAAHPLGEIPYRGWALPGGAVAMDKDYYSFHYPDYYGNPDDPLYIIIENVQLVEDPWGYIYAGDGVWLAYTREPRIEVDAYHSDWSSLGQSYLNPRENESNYVYNAELETLTVLAPMGCNNIVGFDIREIHPVLGFNVPPNVPYSMVFGTQEETSGGIGIE